MSGHAVGEENVTQDLDMATLRRIASQPAIASHHVLELLATLRVEDEERRSWAADCLEIVEAPNSETVAQLAELCMDPCPPVAAWSCKLMRRLGPRVGNWQKAIADTLREHASLAVKQQAARALGGMADLNQESISALQWAANSDDPRLKRLASEALESDNG